MSSYASESGHWYDKDGNPCHEVNGKKTTLREARKLNLFPSVTSVINLAAKPGLENWKIDQTILACLTMPRIENEPEEAYIKRLKEDAKSHAEQAAAKGTEIHGYIEQGFRGELVQLDGKRYYESVIATIVKKCGKQAWSAEKSFYHSAGYGGKVDLHNEAVLIDFKTTEKDLSTVQLWPEHSMQLAAYDAGLGITEGRVRDCYICYVHVKTAESKLLLIPGPDIEKGWSCFYALLEYFYAKTGLGR